jgi:hypothetical protein
VDLQAVSFKRRTGKSEDDHQRNLYVKEMTLAR